MDKPASVAYRDFQRDLIELVNNSGLPAFCLVPVVREALDQLTTAEKAVYERDLEAWDKAQTAAEGEGGGDDVLDD